EGRAHSGTEQRVLDSFERTHQRIKELRKIGRNIEGMAVWNMGDPTEACDSFYANQRFTVTLNGRDQFDLALDLWSKGIFEFAPMFEHFQFGSCLCNHGEGN